MLREFKEVSHPSWLGIGPVRDTPERVNEVTALRSPISDGTVPEYGTFTSFTKRAALSLPICEEMVPEGKGEGNELKSSVDTRVPEQVTPVAEHKLSEVFQFKLPLD